MKKVYSIGLMMGFACHAFCQVENKSDTILLQPIEIKAVRANDKAPFTKTNISKKEIEKMNLGQDLPFLFNQIPNVVVNSDAGNGVGYTQMRIRGTDATRINVTLNGIPYNDAESQATYFVDLPDISSSINSIQIQRGVGTSSNGAGAFGATVALSTNEVSDSFYAELNNSFGSFNTWKHTLKFGTGLIGKHFTFDGRVSKINSDGYIDRASTDLRSFYASTAFIDASNSLRLNIFSGKEKTYQAWYGVPESYLDSNRTYNPAGTEKPGKPYDNETDNYTQTHYQLFYNHKINAHSACNTAIFYTKGAGYYEEYRTAQNLNDYGLPDYYNGITTISQTDLVRQLWLNNNFYGTIFSYQQQNDASQITVGGGWNEYDGLHYGIVTWAQAGFPKDYKYYELPATKIDFNLYVKLQQQFNPHWSAFEDLQYRAINYRINGFEHNPQLMLRKNYSFVNPKIGVTYTKNSYQAYFSYSVAGKEPDRDDFEASLLLQPEAETLHDFELGVEKKQVNYSWGATLYYMLYNNQLVLTGKINDVGAYTRTNIPSSYRFGLELQCKYVFNKWLNISGNLAVSENKIKNFTEYVDNYDTTIQSVYQYSKTNISFSPGIVGGGTITVLPIKNVELSFLSKYVGRQYLDNTSKTSRSLKPFYIQDARFSFTLPKKIFRETIFVFQLNNIFNRKYEPNGYTYSYIYGGQLSTQNYYFPMAGRNFMAAISVKL